MWGSNQTALCCLFLAVEQGHIAGSRFCLGKTRLPQPPALSHNTWHLRVESMCMPMTALLLRASNKEPPFMLPWLRKHPNKGPVFGVGILTRDMSSPPCPASASKCLLCGQDVAQHHQAKRSNNLISWFNLQRQDRKTGCVFFQAPRNMVGVLPASL